ncbi:hypothetical protein CDAR_427001 [Caerostris darwini]|uniref:Uncharacterized protein n=1 Tax=Caerostris darwini TaxID=1538125 RepID=A0AAV4R346_9ARAC|nr:hypothetical protein CDAR_427001 [Caerostris darwini]
MKNKGGVGRKNSKHPRLLFAVSGVASRGAFEVCARVSNVTLMWPVVALLLFRFQPAFNLASGEVVTQWTSSRGKPRTCGYGEVSDFSSAGNGNRTNGTCRRNATHLGGITAQIKAVLQKKENAWKNVGIFSNHIFFIDTNAT